MQSLSSLIATLKYPSSEIPSCRSTTVGVMQLRCSFSGLLNVVAALYWPPAGYVLIIRFFRNVHDFFYFLYTSTFFTLFFFCDSIFSFIQDASGLQSAVTRPSTQDGAYCHSPNHDSSVTCLARTCATRLQALFAYIRVKA